MLGLSYLALLFRHRERAVGPFLIPFVIALFDPRPVAAAARRRRAVTDTRGPLFALHVTFAILAYAAFTFSFVLSVLYLIQKRQLRRVQTGLLFARLPALDVIGRMNRTSVYDRPRRCSGSRSSSGSIWAERVWSRLPDAKFGFAHRDPRRLRVPALEGPAGMGGERVALLSILGFAMIIFSYTFVNLYLSTQHVFR